MTQDRFLDLVELRFAIQARQMFARGVAVGVSIGLLIGGMLSWATR